MTEGSRRGGRGRVWKPVTTQLLAGLLCAVLARSAPAGPRIEVLEGDGAINNIRLHHAKEPVVRVVDQDGKPIPNVAVTFALPASGPGGTFAGGNTSSTVMTDSNGQAVGHGLRPNGNAGQFQIRVTTSVAGQAVTATISQTNAEPATGGGSSKTLVILALVGGAAAAGVAVALGKGKSSAGNTTTTTTTTTSGIVITPGSPVFGPPK
ncbi:MAG TPA: hypothetical protein VMR62_09060 [Bryobacteraceae bacterium]|jgi:hypothetical protein|nr:hypothetical protein [Bryobacteraceae bacterium]